MGNSGYYTSGNLVIYRNRLALLRYFLWVWYVARMGRQRMRSLLGGNVLEKSHLKGRDDG